MTIVLLSEAKEKFFGRCIDGEPAGGFKWKMFDESISLIHECVIC